MSDNDKAHIPIGVPFMGGSDDPSEIIGAESADGSVPSDEDADPGV
jgi:hypothetical protein